MIVVRVRRIIVFRSRENHGGLERREEVVGQRKQFRVPFKDDEQNAFRTWWFGNVKKT